MSNKKFDRQYEISLDDINYFELRDTNNPYRDQIITMTKHFDSIYNLVLTRSEFVKKQNIKDSELDIFLKTNGSNRYLLSQGEIYPLRPVEIYLEPRHNNPAYQFYTFFLGFKIRQIEPSQLFNFLNYQLKGYYSSNKREFIDLVDYFETTLKKEFILHEQTPKLLGKWLNDKKMEQQQPNLSFYILLAKPKDRLSIQERLYKMLIPNEKYLKKGCISPVTELPDFKRIFTCPKDNKPHTPIPWTESTGLLAYLIEQLKKNKIIKVKKDIWVTTADLFFSTKYGSLTNSQLSRSNRDRISFSNKEKIDEIVKLLGWHMETM